MKKCRKEVVQKKSSVWGGGGGFGGVGVESCKVKGTRQRGKGRPKIEKPQNEKAKRKNVMKVQVGGGERYPEPG